MSCIIFIILSPELFFQAYKDNFLALIINIFFIVSFLLIPVILFYRILNAYYFVIAFLCSLTPIFFLPQLLTGRELDGGMIELMLDSNAREIYELLGWNALFIILLMIALLLFVFRLTRVLPRKMILKDAALISITGLLCFIALLAIKVNKYSDYALSAKATLSEAYPFKIPILLYSGIKSKKLRDNYSANTSSFKFNTINNSVHSKRKIEVLVIGESSRYDHWEINGYKRSTSPYLLSEKNLISFSNVASGASITFKSVPLLITRIGINNYSENMKQKSILSAFKEAGFSTAWISNQNAGSSNRKIYHTLDADTAIFVDEKIKDESRFLNKGLYDGSLLIPLQKFLTNTTGDIFIILHTMGSHWCYKYRYPQKLAKFFPDDAVSFLKTNKINIQKLINSYDNSISYTDFFLYQLIELIKKQNTVSSILYVSDHGENLMDRGTKNLFHYTSNYYTIKVPLFIWLSDSLLKYNPQLITALHLNSSKPVSSAESVFYTTLNLSDVAIPSDSNYKKFSLASYQFKGSSQKVLDEINAIISFKALKK